jgi:hypothetical protein
MDITNTRTDTPRTERLLSRMEAEKQDIWQALKTLTEWARGLEIECASWELREQAIAVSENATINGGRGQGLPESREAGQGPGMPSSQAENEATSAGYRAPLPSSSDKHSEPKPIAAPQEDQATWARYWTHWYKRHMQEADEAKRLAKSYGASFRSAERSSAALHACEGIDTPDLAGNKAGWLAEVVHAAAGVEAELAAVTADRDGLLVHQANLVGKLAGLQERIQSHVQPMLDECGQCGRQVVHKNYTPEMGSKP